jgi:hypothetical protein
MICKMKSLAISLTLLLITVTLLGACSNGPPDPVPVVAPSSPEMTPLPDNPPASDDGRPAAKLPPPLIITIPADQLDIIIDGEAAAAGAVATLSDASVGLVQFENGLPAEVEALLERIYQGEYPIDTTGQNPDALPATFTYSDMNGDGIEDLVIILVVGPGDYSNVTAGSTQGNPVIQIIPRPDPGSVVEGLSIPVDELLAMAGNGAGDDLGQGAYLITLGPDDLSRWSEPILPE